jgi:hypothetical protein
MLKDSFKPEDDGKKKLRKSWSGDCNEKKKYSAQETGQRQRRKGTLALFWTAD